jgi:DNA-binding NarL/FixJ family response regulator
VTMAATVAPSLLYITEGIVPLAYAEVLTPYREVGRTDSVTVALAAVRSRRPDVVVVDVVTLERLEQVAAAIPHMAGSRSVVVSGLSAEVALLSVMAAGAHAFLLRPPAPDLLERTVSEVLAGHKVVDPACTGWMVEPALYGGRLHPDNGLTLRQSQVLGLVRGGLTNREIARVLGLSRDTVKTHLRQAMKRLGVHDRWAATEAGPLRKEAALVSPGRG